MQVFIVVIQNMWMNFIQLEDLKGAGHRLHIAGSTLQIGWLKKIGSLSLSGGSESESEFEPESYLITGGHSASLSWNKAPIWGLWSGFYYCQTVVVLLILGTLSHERMGLSFTTAVVPRQRSHSQVRVPWDSQSFSAVLD
jgi:hypothetical protein